jgi:hypothetical protein
MAEFRDVMGMPSHTANHLAAIDHGPLSRIIVSLFLAFFFGVFAAGPEVRAEEAPDAHEILRTVRVAQAAQNHSLHGELRSAGKTIPFRMSFSGGTIRYEFTNPALTLQLRLGEKGARLEEITRSGAEKISPARFDTRVGGMDISYEDLSLRFLYWPKAAVDGEQTMVLQKCWIVRVEPGSTGDSQYASVKLWIGKNSGALMQAEACDSNGKLVRRFKVISGQKTDDGLWILKEMRIEWVAPGQSQDRTPTYLEIEGVDK